MFRDATIQVADLTTFNTAVNEAPFMFGEDVLEFLDALRGKALRLRATNFQLENPAGLVNRTFEDVSNENVELLGWFDQQARAIFDVFGKYISM